MCQVRTKSRSICRGSISRCLLAVLLVATVAPAIARDPNGTNNTLLPATDEVRSVVSSGLGEWGLGQMFPDSALWLDLEDGARARALLWPETNTPARGAVLILADVGKNAESGLAGALARELAHRKFAVLSLGLEPPPAGLAQILERPYTETEGEPGRDSLGEALPATIDVMETEAPGDLETAYRERIGEELLAGVAELRKREYTLLAVIGVGRGSNHVVAAAAEIGAPPALVWVQPKFFPRDERQLASVLGSASVPRILELSASNGGERRKVALARAGVKNFSVQNVGSGTKFLPRDSKALAGRIAAWLTPVKRQ